jgi:DNA-binding response OmpR family regulator
MFQNAEITSKPFTCKPSLFWTDVFNDPLSALSNYKTGLYDLLLLDIKMPHMNGFELYQKIKDMDHQVKVCFISKLIVFLENL